MKDVDVARLAFGAYQSYQDKPARISADGQYFGMVNPCRFGDQCEWHACYCNHESGTYRKCHYSWYTGNVEPDRSCELFEPNPHWRTETGDFYDDRDRTVARMKELGLVEVEEEEGE